MRSLWASLTLALAIGWGGAPGMVAAQDGPVVVELYTSQGCSSCPPADALLAELAGREDVIALALHVDYWDYIGWKDVYASRAFTQRQKGYARAAGHRTVYTPQMIVGGTDHIVGYKPMKLAERIATHAAQPETVRLSARRDGASVRIVAEALTDAPARAIVQLVRYLPEDTTEIRRGENAGHTYTYTNIVTDWDMVGGWDGTGRLDLRVRAPGDAPAVVILQEPGHGRILAAARVQ